MRRRAPPVPERLRHRIIASANGFSLVTHYGYILYTHTDRDAVASYYAWHCPVE